MYVIGQLKVKNGLLLRRQTLSGDRFTLHMDVASDSFATLALYKFITYLLTYRVQTSCTRLQLPVRSALTVTHALVVSPTRLSTE